MLWSISQLLSERNPSYKNERLNFLMNVIAFENAIECVSTLKCDELPKVSTESSSNTIKQYHLFWSLYSSYRKSWLEMRYCESLLVSSVILASWCCDSGKIYCNIFPFQTLQASLVNLFMRRVAEFVLMNSKIVCQGQLIYKRVFVVCLRMVSIANIWNKVNDWSTHVGSTINLNLSRRNWK